MNHVLEPYINAFVIVYLIDICMFYDSHEQHIDHLCMLRDISSRVAIGIARIRWRNNAR